MEYPIVIAPISSADGGGYVGYVPDLLGCMSDGETREEALANTLLAIEEWLDAFRQTNPDDEVPKPGSMAARYRADHGQMVAIIKKLMDDHQLIDEKIEELARSIEDIQDRLDHMESWSRFSLIVGEETAVATISSTKLLGRSRD
jgi:antitoxin HicB